MSSNVNDISRYRWWRAHSRLAAALLLVVVVAIAGGSYYVWPRTVFVTDGAHVFSDDLGPIEEKIKVENDRVVAQGLPYVSIAVVDIMHPDPGVDVATAAGVRHKLEGAYLEQLTANQPIAGRPQVPQIRLLLGNEGSRESSWYDMAIDLESRVNGTDHLVAVAGLGVSVDNTRHLVDELSTHQVAMVGSTITADGFNNIQGMVRVAPTNTDEAQAAVKYLQRSGALAAAPRILLVQDQNPTDTYAQSLGTAFTAALDNPGLLAPTFAYDSRLANAATVLANHADRVCSADKVGMVYFAGRGVDLVGLLNGLAGRSCRDTPITVVTGDDASELVDQALWRGAGANLALLFTALAHSDMWDHDPAAASPITRSEFGNCDRCFHTLFPSDDLDDGNAIMSHDAVQTAVIAIRDMAGPRGSAPSTSAVAQELLQVSVPGASGYLCFDTNHNPINKAIPIMTYGPDGRPHYRALSSAMGTPPTDNCASRQ